MSIILCFNPPKGTNESGQVTNKDTQYFETFGDSWKNAKW